MCVLGDSEGGLESGQRYTVDTSCHDSVIVDAQRCCPVSDGGREGQEAMHLHTAQSYLIPRALRLWANTGLPYPAAAAALIVTKGKRQTKGSILAHSQHTRHFVP